MIFHGGTGALRAPLRVCWVPSSPSPSAHRTHLQPSLRSLPSSQRSFARGRTGRGQGRGIPGRALAAGTCSPADGASRRSAPPPGLHLPGGNAGSRLATGPPHPPSGRLALKGTRPEWPPAGVAPALAPPRFPHLAPPPSAPSRSPATAQKSFTVRVHLGLCGAGWVELNITVAAASLRSGTPLEGSGGPALTSPGPA